MHAAVPSIAALAMLMLLPCAASPMQGDAAWRVRTTPHFSVFYRGEQPRLDEIARYAEKTYDRISSDLGHHLRVAVPLIVLATDDELPRDPSAAATLIAASQAPEGDHVFLSVESFGRHPRMLDHDLTHQFQFDLMPDLAPGLGWLLEALADHEAGPIDAAQLATVRDAVRQGALPSVTGISENDRIWGRVLLDYMASQIGDGALRAYVAAIRAGSTSTHQAVQRAFGFNLAAFDRRFQAYVRSVARKGA